MRAASLLQIEDHLLALGWAQEIRAGRGPAARAEVRALVAGWLREGLPFTEGLDRRPRFDPAEVMNWTIERGLAGRDRFWHDRYVGTERRLVRKLHGVDGDGVPAPQHWRPRRFTFRLERAYSVREPAGERARLRLPSPLAGVGQRIVSLKVDANVDWAHRVSPGRVEWQVPAGWTGVARLALQATVHCAPDAELTPPPDARELARLTRLDEGWIEKLPEVLAIAGELQAEDADPLGLPHAAFDAVSAKLRCGSLHYGDLPARGALAEVLRRRWADCQLAAALFCAVCRVRGVPARIVSGYQLYAERPAHHYWAQAWIAGKGWRSWDFSAWHLSEACRDPAWFGLFRGCVEHRLVLQVFPDLFTGMGSAPFPRDWHMLYHAQGGAFTTRYMDALSGRIVYEERLLLTP